MAGRCGGSLITGRHGKCSDGLIAGRCGGGSIAGWCCGGLIAGMCGGSFTAVSFVYKKRGQLDEKVHIHINLHDMILIG